ncbi:MAG: hypothetical protein K6L81_01880 [Agarilytica sp.]
MPLITDPDLLSDSAVDDASANVFIDPVGKTIKLNASVGALIAIDGVTGKCVYSFAKEEWRNDSHTKGLAAPTVGFPFEPITDEFLELKDGWDWADDPTRKMLRSVGWIVRDVSNNVTQHWPNITALGNIVATDQLSYDVGAGSTDFAYAGKVNEAIQVIDDPDGDGSYGDGFDRSGVFTIRNREQGQIFSSSDLSAIGVQNLLAPKAFAFPVGTAVDSNISADDITISGSAPYTGMSITFYSAAQSRDVSGTSREFGVVIDGNSGTKREIYEFVQWALRQNTDQDSGVGTLQGNVMPDLLRFVGNTLETLFVDNYQGGGGGVWIDNFNAVDTNDLAFKDNADAVRTFDFVAAGELQFNTNLVNDIDTRYFLYLRDTNILVNDNAGVPITGDLSGASSVSYDFDFDGNIQNGRTPGADTPVTAVAIGLDTGQYVRQDAVIVRSNSNNITLVAAIERSYENAA